MKSKFNSNKSPTRCNNFPVYYPDVYLQLNMFRAFSRPSSGTQCLQWQPLVLPSYHGDSRAVFVFEPARPRTQHGYHHDTKVKPEAATADIELLMMGGKTPKTCWAVNKRQDNELKNCCIWLVIYLNHKLEVSNHTVRSIHIYAIQPSSFKICAIFLAPGTHHLLVLSYSLGWFVCITCSGIVLT